MNNLQQKLTHEIAAQRAKGAAQHRVAGYRITEGAGALLGSVRDRQKFAISWRETAIASGADSVRSVKVRHGPRSQFTTNYKVFSVAGRDVYAVAPTKGSNGSKREIDLSKRDLADHYQAYGRVQIIEAQ